jgi:hypothetical protein
MRRFAVVFLVLGVAACFLEPTKPEDHIGAGDAGVDGALDSLPCVGTPTCNGDTLHIDCSMGSAIDLPCGWGCGGSGSAHCLALDPTGGALQAADTQGLPAIAATVTDATIDTDALSITPAPGALDARIVGGVAVFRFGQLSITGSVHVVGSHPLALVAQGEISITGSLDLTGGCGSNNPGPGGLPGGFAGQPAMAPIGGGEATGNGGGGGGLGGMGGRGGRKSSTTAATGGSVLGDATIANLTGGGGGGGGGDLNSGMGGGGGGAVQLISNTDIAVGGGGAINAGGCGGYGSTAVLSAGGGGAGGMIVLEAPTISIAGVLAVNGGGGGGGDLNGMRGGNGSASSLQAPGGTSTTAPSAAGGSGAAGSVATGGAGGDANHSGGGGGGVGWMRFNTRPSGLTKTSGALLSPDLGTTGTTTGGVAATH